MRDNLKPRRTWVRVVPDVETQLFALFGEVPLPAELRSAYERRIQEFETPRVKRTRPARDPHRAASVAAAPNSIHLIFGQGQLHLHHNPACGGSGLVKTKPFFNGGISSHGFRRLVYR